MTKYFIPEHKFESFDREVKRIAKKCRKAGVKYTYEVGNVTTIEVVVHENYRVSENLKYNTMMNVYPVELDIKLKHNGWNVLGVVVDADGIPQAYFGDNTELAKEYLHVDMCRCDHCHTRRARKSVCVLEHEDGRRMVIGTTCVKEFTDGLDGSLCKEILEFFKGKYHMNINVDESRFDCSMDEFENYFGGSVGSVRDGASRYYITKEFVSYAAALIDKYGYVSKSMAEESCGRLVPTAHLISSFIDDVRKGEESVLEKHETIAEKAIEWCKTLNDDEIKSTYMLNLRELCRDDFCTSRHWGMLVSLVPTYKREIEKHKAAKKTVQSEYVSEVGTRTTFDVKLLADITFEDFSCYARDIITKHVVKMDCGGNVLVWITEKHPHKEIGETFQITGTVKEHSEYKGVKQTVLTRCKIV